MPSTTPSDRGAFQPILQSREQRNYHARRLKSPSRPHDPYSTTAALDKAAPRAPQKRRIAEDRPTSSPSCSSAIAARPHSCLRGRPSCSSRAQIRLRDGPCCASNSTVSFTGNPKTAHDFGARAEFSFRLAQSPTGFELYSGGWCRQSVRRWRGGGSGNYIAMARRAPIDELGRPLPFASEPRVLEAEP
ncbi:hypothetical protein SAMN05444581_101391 [Methylocapsa palsarum]|uniref:Uncharacterized protein n=1 Tax=Methylocapsa palsarum TaxID=1612308 RepID=A0A1I3W710_9HYPH|nr:hypothetical protein SAMN05444581_101391 [Methylocapsa palsarum]